MKLTVVGFGLLGCSFARALKAARDDVAVEVVDPSPEARAYALQSGVAGSAQARVEDADPERDLVFLAAPLQKLIDGVGGLVDRFGEHAVVFDCGSVKEAVVRGARGSRFFSSFVPAHPMAGHHLSGPEHGDAALFGGKPFVLTPEPETSAQAVSTVEAVVGAIGARPARMTASQHDRCVAIVSHAPHLFAFASILAAQEQAEDEGLDPFSMAGPGFRDFTRIAGAAPELWAEILILNAAHTRDTARAALEKLAELERLAEAGDKDALAALIQASSDKRRSLDND